MAMAKEIVLKIKFKENDYILLYRMHVGGGMSITTIDDYKRGLCTFAVLHRDGKVIQFGKNIGSVDDIIILGFEIIEFDPDEAMKGLSGTSWKRHEI